MRGGFTVLLGCSVALLSGTVRGSDPECGVRCLYVALKGFDFPVPDYAAFRKQLGTPPEGGYSLAQLADAAQAAGAQTLGVQTSLEELAKRKRPFTFLAHLKSDHFLLVTDFENHKVSIIDPPRSSEVPEGTFQVLWDGTGLLISPRPIAMAVDARSGGRTALLILGGLVVAAGIGGLLYRRRWTDAAAGR